MYHSSAPTASSHGMLASCAGPSASASGSPGTKSGLHDLKVKVGRYGMNQHASCVGEFLKFQRFKDSEKLAAPPPLCGLSLHFCLASLNLFSEGHDGVRPTSLNIADSQRLWYPPPPPLSPPCSSNLHLSHSLLWVYWTPTAQHQVYGHGREWVVVRDRGGGGGKHGA